MPFRTQVAAYYLMNLHTVPVPLSLYYLLVNIKGAIAAKGRVQGIARQFTGICSVSSRSGDEPFALESCRP